MIHRPTLEEYAPYGIAIPVAVAAWFWAEYIQPFPGELAVSTLTLGVVTAAFTATKRNMLLSMSGTRVLKFARKTGYGQILLGYFGQAVFGGFSLVLISVARLLLPPDLQPWPALWSFWLALWSAAVTIMVGALIRNEMVMSLVFSRWMASTGSEGNQGSRES